MFGQDKTSYFGFAMYVFHYTVLFYLKSLLHEYYNDMFCKLVDNTIFIYALKSSNKTSKILFGTIFDSTIIMFTGHQPISGQPAADVWRCFDAGNCQSNPAV